MNILKNKNPLIISNVMSIQYRDAAIYGDTCHIFPMVGAFIYQQGQVVSFLPTPICEVHYFQEEEEERYMTKSKDVRFASHFGESITIYLRKKEERKRLLTVGSQVIRMDDETTSRIPHACLHYPLFFERLKNEPHDFFWTVEELIENQVVRIRREHETCYLKIREVWSIEEIEQLIEEKGEEATKAQQEITDLLAKKLGNEE